MAFIARKPFLFDGVQYEPGDPVPGFPERFDKSERFLSSGFVVEKKPLEVKPLAEKPVRKTTAKAKIGV